MSHKKSHSFSTAVPMSCESSPTGFKAVDGNFCMVISSLSMRKGLPSWKLDKLLSHVVIECLSKELDRMNSLIKHTTAPKCALPRANIC
jgi:hypothetical protein